MAVVCRLVGFKRTIAIEMASVCVEVKKADPKIAEEVEVYYQITWKTKETLVPQQRNFLASTKTPSTVIGLKDLNGLSVVVCCLFLM